MKNGGYDSVTRKEKIAYIVCVILCFASLIGIVIIGNLFGFHEDWSFNLLLLLGFIAGMCFVFILAFGLAIEGEETFKAITNNKRG